MKTIFTIRRYVLIWMLSMLALSAFGQYSVSGTVTDSSGEPLIGVAVVAVNYSSGTLTDFDGSYELSGYSDEEEIKLEYSYLGYKTATMTIAGSGTSTVDVVMETDYLKLDEVVITGASAATSKKNLGNAISTVDSREIANSGAQGIDQALSGKLPGALVNQNSGNPAGGISVTLRGNSTVFGNSDPLYIIDGVIMDNSSTEVLDLGGYAQNRLVDINPNDIEKIEIIKGAAAAAIYGSRASNGVVQIFTKKGNSGKPKITFSTGVKMNSLRKQIEENDVNMAYASPSSPATSEKVETKRYNMQDYIFRTGYGSDNYLSISGGEKNTRYFFSASANFNEGIIDNSDFTRYTGRLNLDQVISSTLSASIGMGYTRSQSNEIPNGGIVEFYGALTGYNFNNNNYNPEPDESGNYTSPIGFVPNPLEVINKFEFGQSTNRFNGNFNLKYTPFKGFGVDLILGLDTYSQDGDGYIPVGSTVKSTGWARTANFGKTLLNADLNFRYNTDINDLITSTSLLGLTAQRDESQFISITSDNLSPVVTSTSAGTIISRGDVKTERNIQGGFFQQTFGYADKLYFTAAARVDAASPFGKDERVQFYPKASVSYVVSEDWNNDNIDLLKLRASYGESGNLTALSAYERLSNYNPTPINGQTGLVPSTRLGNTDLKPERQKELELGFDLAVLDSRLGLEMSYYNVKVEDLLLTRTLAPSTGFSSRLENVGEMTNRGIEVLVKAVPVRNNNLNWNTSITFSTNDNEVNGIEEGKIALPKSFGVSVAQNGYPLGVLDGFLYARDANGEILLDENGLPSRAKDENGATIRTIIGDPNPDWTGSWINELTIGNIGFRMQLDAVQGFDIFNFTDRVNSRSSFGGGKHDAEELRGDLPPGYNNAAYNIWERYIEDGSFVKLRELALSYSMKPKAVNVSSLKFTLTGRNLLSFDKYSGWDPEVSTAGQTNGVRGFDFNEVPIPRTIMFGLSATF